MKFLLVLAVVPSIIIAIILYLSDKKEREPIDKLAKAFGFGVIAIIITLLFSILVGIIDIDVTELDMFDLFIYSFVAISLVEELSKWLCGHWVLKNNNDFNYMYDGIIYYAFVALGFATVENILYAVSGGFSTTLIRAVTTVPAHAFFGIISGYYYALATVALTNEDKKGKNKYLALSIIMPVLLHGFYDFCLLTEEYIFLIVYLVFVVSLYVMTIANARKVQKEDRPFIDIENSKEE